MIWFDWNINSCRSICNSFIMSKFDYCPLLRHLCGHVSNQKLEKILEGALRILFANLNYSYPQLLKKPGTPTLLIQWLHWIALAVLKSLHGLNPSCLNDMFTAEHVPYQVRDATLLEQSYYMTTTFGPLSISDIGAKMEWFWFTQCFNRVTDFANFKGILQMWTGSLLY